MDKFVKNNIEFHVERARETLKEYGLPTTLDGLREVKPLILPDMCVDVAIDVLREYEDLQDALQENNTEKALSALYYLMVRDRELYLYRMLPNKPIKRNYPEFRKIAECQLVTDQILRDQFKTMERNKGNGGRNAYTDIDKENIRQLASYFKTTHATKKSKKVLARVIHSILDKTAEHIEKSDYPNEVKKLYRVIHKSRFRKGKLLVTKSGIESILKTHI